MAQLLFYQNQDFTGDKYTISSGSGGSIQFPIGGGPQEITVGDETYSYIDGIFDAVITGASAPEIDISDYPDIIYGPSVTLSKENNIINSILFFGNRINADETINASHIYCVTATYNSVEYFAFGNLAGDRFRIAAAVSLKALEDTEQLKPETDDDDEYGDKSKGSTDAWGQGVAGTGNRNFDGATDIRALLRERNGIENLISYSAGGYHIYIINSGAYRGLSKYLWLQKGNLWKKLSTINANPTMGIVGCHKLPQSLTYRLAEQYPAENILLAGLSISVNELGSDSKVSRLYYSGELASTIKTYEPAPLILPGLIDSVDYSDTYITVRLPYCGECQIDPSYCIGGLGDDGKIRDGTLRVIYRCDITNGNVIAIVVCTDRNGKVHIPAMITGNCAYEIPFAGNNNGLDQAFGSLIGLGTSVLSAVGTGGLTSPAVVGSAMNFAQNTLLPKQSTIANPMTGSTSILQDGIITVTVDYPLISNPQNYNMVVGRPSDTGGTVSEYKGFTVAKGINVEGIETATDAQKAEIERIFKEGVYL